LSHRCCNASCDTVRTNPFGTVRDTAYSARGTVFGVGLEELSDEEFGVLANLLPVSLMEDDPAIAALLDEVRETLAAER
jgi:hypothetical protein